MRDVVREPLLRRREVLAETCQRLDAADVRFSEGVVGQGKALYGSRRRHGQAPPFDLPARMALRPVAENQASAEWDPLSARDSFLSI